MDVTRRPTLKSDCLYYLQPKWRSVIQSAKTRRGADCGSDHELLIGEKERYTHLNAEFQRIAGEIRKPSSVISEKK